MGKKLVGPLSEILETESAKSLMYECIRTVVQGMTSQEKIVRQAVDKLKDMLEDTDPNIKFLALQHVDLCSIRTRELSPNIRGTSLAVSTTKIRTFNTAR